MLTFVEKLLGVFREFGVLGGVLYGVGKALRRSGAGFHLYFYEIMVQPISEKPLAPKNLTKSFELREIKAADPELAKFPRSEKVVAERFEQGVICLGGFQKSEFIGYLWIQFGKYYEDEVRCLFAPEPESEAVFDFDIYIFPDHRFGIGFIALWDGANEFLKRRGIRFTCSRVSRFNVASRKSHEHFGWKCIGRTVFLCGATSQLMLGTIKPYFHFSLKKANLPKIRINTNSRLVNE